jgi:hypothetical protein
MVLGQLSRIFNSPDLSLPKSLRCDVLGGNPSYPLPGLPELTPGEDFVVEFALYLGNKTYAFSVIHHLVESTAMPCPYM